MSKTKRDLRFSVRGSKNGKPFELYTDTRENADRIASDFAEQGAVDVVVSETN
ncbi:hypothetical protein [Erythrobacter sp.]|jgi:hypothetical protein|uniref:hypothetical protein n=1 Tax=Erythrobacter sp. TaxID=1042 RepID=UPI002EA6A63C|nr:hypothetical protein [Erythrobacter sp.]